jgi:hypothetical protein
LLECLKENAKILKYNYMNFTTWIRFSKSNQFNYHLQHLALGREPQPIVDELRVPWHQLVLEMHGAPVQGDGFDGTVGDQLKVVFIAK